MRIAIFGSGGIGGYYGGKLAQAGTDVVFLARGEHLRALKREGLRVRSVAGDFHVHPVVATDNVASVGAVDYVLLGVKTWQVPSVATQLGSLLSAHTAVVTLQNGVEAPVQLADVIGGHHVLPGTVRIFSEIEAPGVIRHSGGPASIAFAESDNEPSDRVLRLRERLKRAGLRVDEPRNIHAALWEKFLFVVPMGTIGALARAPVGVLRSMAETRMLLEEAMLEIQAVAHARGIDLPSEVAETTLRFLDTLPAAGTSSLQRDIAAGRPSELDAWTGAVVRLSDASGVPAPIHRIAFHSLLPLERRARGQTDFA